MSILFCSFCKFDQIKSKNLLSFLVSNTTNYQNNFCLFIVVKVKHSYHILILTNPVTYQTCPYYTNFKCQNKYGSVYYIFSSVRALKSHTENILFIGLSRCCSIYDFGLPDSIEHHVRNFSVRPTSRVTSFIQSYFMFSKLQV